MSSGNDEKGETSYALTLFEKKTLSETRRFALKCGNKIGEDKKNFAQKSRFGLWWDAKGLFNSSNIEEVTAHMEKYRKFYEKIDNFPAQVEKGDPKSYDRLLDIYKELEEIERDAKRDVENSQSSKVCAMLREFLDKKYNLDHNLKKVECIVLRQKMNEVEQTCKSSKDKVNKLNDQMIELIDENRGIREFLEKMRKEKNELVSEAEKRSEAIRQESDEKLDKLIKENHDIKEIIEKMRKEKEEQALEVDKRSEAIRRESDEKLKQVLKEAEERSEERIQKMKEDSDRLRLEAELVRRESDEKLKRAVEEANKRSEARMLEMAEQNRASLQKMSKILEAMNLS